MSDGDPSAVSVTVTALGYYVDDVDETLAVLGTSGAPVVSEPEDQPWGERVARTRDPQGNLVILGAVL